MEGNKFFRSFKFAGQGIAAAVKRESNMKFHLAAAVAVILAAAMTGISSAEWLIIILLIGGMIALEMINTAIERVVDLASPERHPLAKESKDIAAGAVLVFAAASAIIGILIFLPKWF
ncbi:MAG TPA: diacylglycerol kinase family protein [Planococcus sp. (in: firmicutes)]|nr:diacylglycerol kinase family protein [Planococcus sp. (in: firmicutes)]